MIQEIKNVILKATESSYEKIGLLNPVMFINSYKLDYMPFLVDQAFNELIQEGKIRIASNKIQPRYQCFGLTGKKYPLTIKSFNQYKKVFLAEGVEKAKALNICDEF